MEAGALPNLSGLSYNAPRRCAPVGLEGGGAMDEVMDEVMDEAVFRNSLIQLTSFLIDEAPNLQSEPPFTGYRDEMVLMLKDQVTNQQAAQANAWYLELEQELEREFRFADLLLWMKDAAALLDELASNPLPTPAST